MSMGNSPNNEQLVSSLTVTAPTVSHYVDVLCDMGPAQLADAPVLTSDLQVFYEFRNTLIYMYFVDYGSRI
jgi:hypothetical protein